jgi:hypothetical protein
MLEKTEVIKIEDKHGGGPKTEEGKAAVRLNALKHGLLSKEVLLASEDKDVFNEFRDSLIAETQPQGEIEALLVERMVSSLWRLKRAIKIETSSMQVAYEISSRKLAEDWKGEPATWVMLWTREYGQNSAWPNLSRYETTLERQFYKALHELIRLQAARRGEQPPVPVAVDVNIDRGD